MKHLIKYLNQCFQQGFSKNLEISRKGEWASPDPFSQKFSIVLKTPDKTLSLIGRDAFVETLLYVHSCRHTKFALVRYSLP